MRAFQAFLISGICLLSLGAAETSAQALDPAILGRLPALNAILEQARKDLAEHRFLQVAQRLEPCLKQMPNHFEAHFLLAQVAYESRDFEGALGHMQISEQNLRDLAKVFEAQREALRAQEESDLMEAEANFDQLGARNVDPGACSGILYRIRQKAIDDLEARKGHLHDQVRPFAIPSAYHFLHGNALYRLGRRDEALVQYRQAIQEDPAHAHAWNNLVGLQLESRAFAQARLDLERAETTHVAIRPELKKAVLEASARAQNPASAPRH